MTEAIAFYVLSAFILGFGVLVVTARNTVHSVLFLVAQLPVRGGAVRAAAGAEFLAVIQMLVYAGGIVVLYLFVVMLVNLKRPPETHHDPRRQSRLGFDPVGHRAVRAGGHRRLRHRARRAAVTAAAGSAPPGLQGNTEQLGRLLYTDYLVPFEVASMLLLVAMIGAILLAKRSCNGR